jgi:hypothetical protein
VKYCRHGTSESALLPVSFALVVAAVLLSCALTCGSGSGSARWWLFVLSAWAVRRLAVISVTCNAARKSLDIWRKGIICITRSSFVLEK